MAAAVAAYVAPGPKQNVSAICRELGVSRKTFYKYVHRFHALGVEGFYPQSRRPRRSPTKLPAELEDVLVAIRKSEADGGWDYGAEAVLMRLEEQLAAGTSTWPAERRLPARSTVNQVFDQRGQLVKVPQRKPRRRIRRFERSEVNALWQFDGFEYTLATGETVVVLQLIDDCSRTDLALQAAVSENGSDIWATFCLAVERYGLPVQLLTDNGSAFSGKRRGWTSVFERNLADLGVQAISSRISHPQTCGKNERAHQRPQKWLRRRPAARDIAELQPLLDQYRHGYNNRRNAVLGKLTPHQRFDLGPLATVPDLPPAITTLTRHTVTATGSIGLDGCLLGLGRKHAGHQVTVFRTGAFAAVFDGDHLVRSLTLDYNRRYQPQ
ncbi:helix-turn-helix domain-containing protein, partial [Nocardioides aquiterrae]|uniref:helix-turn-helix domain-containing protein n=1 Tax=Nocardioides aquiterrae TaxID=203799 RepID=UPI0031DD4396